MPASDPPKRLKIDLLFFLFSTLSSASFWASSLSFSSSAAVFGTSLLNHVSMLTAICIGSYFKLEHTVFGLKGTYDVLILL